MAEPRQIKICDVDNRAIEYVVLSNKSDKEIADLLDVLNAADHIVAWLVEETE